MSVLWVYDVNDLPGSTPHINPMLSLYSWVVIFLKCKLPFSYIFNVYCIGYFSVVQNIMIKSNLQNKELIWGFCSRETRIMLPSWLGSMTASNSYGTWSRELRGSTHLQLQSNDILPPAKLYLLDLVKQH